VIHQLPHGTIHHARAEAVYPLIEAGSVTLVHADGPYGLDKAAWDKVRDLAAWYRPHIAEWGRICAPSASVYLWNTAEGWAAIHPEMVAAGWHFAGLIVWYKTGANPALIGAANANLWPDIIEVCGHYQRGDAYHVNDGTGNVWTYAPTAMGEERLYAPGMAPHRVTGAMQRVGLHPCQKPLLFARRIVEASSRPGDLVCEPFGGTCRIAAACEDIARWGPEKARRYVCVEMDEDGRDYVPAVLAALRGEPTGGQPTGQTRLFAAGGAA
jgi:DNA modification methylase